MRAYTAIFLKLCGGTYFILASLYCFLAFIPYTYLFVIVSPPYQWLNTFAHYNLLFLWIAVGASVLSRWLLCDQRTVRLTAVTDIGLALAISICNPISHVQNNLTAFAWSVGFLLPLLANATFDLVLHGSAIGERDCYPSIAFSNASYVGFLCGLISVAALRLHAGMHGTFMLVQRYDAELMFWVIVEHVTLAILIASVINLIRLLLPRFTKNAFLLGLGVVGFVAFIGFSIGCLLFVEDSLSLRGWPAWIYSILFAVTATLFSLRLFVPTEATKPARVNPWLPAAVAIVLIVVAVYGPLAFDLADDWNGLLHQLFALLLWVVLAVGICRTRPIRKQYSFRVILAIIIATCAIYETLNYSKSVWASDIGSNNPQILHEMSNYSAQNTSFGLVDRLLGNQDAEYCDASCKTLRQYSNIRKAKIPGEVKLVDELLPTNGPKPSIFIIVIDSLRPDYVGAYNPRVDFTPNIDAFAHDSIVMRRAYTDYAGTSLSEPSIWSGALLLHAHYAQPFQRVNSLANLARVDGYQIVISYDDILKQLIAPSEDMIMLDTDKKMWADVEISSTIEQLENVLDHRSPQAAPVFFYTQSMNVQIHANNNLPKRTSQNWQTRVGFDDRIAYTLHQADYFLGSFFEYLKTKKLYDNSIIILTSDHGDATGELGRMSHSFIIYPEVMHVPLLVHLPREMRGKYVYDENRLATLIDIAPSLYYLLGHRPIRSHLLIGHPMFMGSEAEFQSYPRPDVFLASDSIATYGILTGDGRWMYTTYDSPARSMLFDLLQDPNAQRNVLTPALKKEYDGRILQYFHILSDFYGHHPTGG